MTPVVLGTGLACTISLLLAGCARTAPQSAVGDEDVRVPRDVIAFRIDLETAEYISDECRSDFRVNREYQRDWTGRFEEKYGPDPAWAHFNMEEVVSPKRLQRKLFAYVERRGVLLTEPETWCAAGRAEVAENTRIGKLLVAR